MWPLPWAGLRATQPGIPATQLCLCLGHSPSPHGDSGGALPPGLPCGTRLHLAGASQLQKELRTLGM